MIEETRFLKTVKIITFLLIVFLSAYKLAKAQDTRNPEFNHYLRYTAQNGELAYWRVETLPVRVCQMADYGVEWNESIQQAIVEMNVAVPSTFTTDVTGCDVIINIVDRIPDEKCWVGNRHASACVDWSVDFSYPMRVYAWSDGYQLAVLLHELMHAYGVIFHPDRQDSVVSGYPSAAWYLQSHLTAFDVNLLQYLYSQRAYHDEHVVIEDHYCAWVEAHREQLASYEKYRCR